MPKLNYSVVICALARDCEDMLSVNIPRIEALRELFLSSSVVIVENDSKDATKSILKEWAKKSRGVSVISQDYNTVTIPEATSSNLYPGTSLYRIEKMATYRNIYMDWMEKQDEKFDLVVMIDIDVRSFSISGIRDAIVNAPNNWGALFANGFTDTKIFGKKIYTMYHDMFAYCEELPVEKPYFTYGKLFQLKKTINSKLAHHNYLAVLSAFGGLGIYKSKAIEGLRYNAVENGDKYMEAMCEHVPFNKEITNIGYKSYICKNLKVYYGKSDPLIVIRNILPLSLFKLLCLAVKFRKLKE